MFMPVRNSVCNNGAFTRLTIFVMSKRKTHPAMARMFEAARELGLLFDGAPSDMARLLNKSPQAVNNWMTRGPSKELRLEFQRLHGVSATWIETGTGPRMIGGTYDTRQSTSALQANCSTMDTLQTGRAKRMAQLAEIIEKIDDYGLVALIEKAKDLAREYPARKRLAS